MGENRERMVGFAEVSVRNSSSIASQLDAEHTAI